MKTETIINICYLILNLCLCFFLYVLLKYIIKFMSQEDYNIIEWHKNKESNKIEFEILGELGDYQKASL